MRFDYLALCVSLATFVQAGPDVWLYESGTCAPGDYPDEYSGPWSAPSSCFDRSGMKQLWVPRAGSNAWSAGTSYCLLMSTQTCKGDANCWDGHRTFAASCMSLSGSSSLCIDRC